MSQQLKLSRTDQTILDSLQHFGFQKTSMIDVINVSERTVRRRIKNMMNNGVFKIIAVPNPVLLGLKAWSKIGIKVEPAFLNDVARVLVKHPCIYFTAYALGRYDIIIAAHFATIDALAHFVNTELTTIRGVEYVETMMLVSPRKYYHFNWPSSVFLKTDKPWDPYKNVTLGDGYQMDEIDLEILNILREDGLARPKKISSMLGVGEHSIRRHEKRLLRDEVFRLEVVPNPEILEYEAWATMGIVTHSQSTHEIIDSIIIHPEVYLASAALGRFSIVIAVRFHHANLLTKFVTTYLAPLKGVSSIETYLHNRPLKYHNVDWISSHES